MNLDEARKTYYEFSGKVSEIARTLSLSGLAVIWIFKIDSKEGPHVPQPLILPAFLLVLALALDFLQYVVQTAVWGTFQRYKERIGTTEKATFKAPAWFNWPATFFLFPAKILVVCSAYVVLLNYLWQHLR
jgi:hypothetical protein